MGQLGFYTKDILHVRGGLSYWAYSTCKWPQLYQCKVCYQFSTCLSLKAPSCLICYPIVKDTLLSVFTNTYWLRSYEFWQIHDHLLPACLLYALIQPTLLTFALPSEKSLRGSASTSNCSRSHWVRTAGVRSQLNVMRVEWRAEFSNICGLYLARFTSQHSLTMCDHSFGTLSR